VHWIVPGHGTPATTSEAMGRLSLDRTYLSKLASHPGMSTSSQDEASARAFLNEIGEQRANSNEGWSMHIDNLVNIFGN
jgi:hypothetical protein